MGDPSRTQWPWDTQRTAEDHHDEESISITAATRLIIICIFVILLLLLLIRNCFIRRGIGEESAVEKQRGMSVVCSSTWLRRFVTLSRVHVKPSTRSPMLYHPPQKCIAHYISTPLTDTFPVHCIPVKAERAQSRLFCTTPGVNTREAYEELSVQELSTMLQNPSEVSDVQFVDVREPWELDIASLPLFKILPLGRLLSGGEDALNAEKQTVVMCHHGRRSMAASQYLSEHGFHHAFNVTGGIDLYSTAVDPSVPRY